MFNYLGWLIIIFQQKTPKPSPPTSETKTGREVIRWEAYVNGINWIDELVSEGKALELKSGGHPCLYTAQTKYLLPDLESNPPFIRTWSNLELDKSRLLKISPKEWLIIEVWDMS